MAAEVQEAQADAGSPGALPDEAAFAVAAELQVEAALALARRVGCPPEDAADAVQDALVAAWRKRSQCRGDFRPWFLAIVRRQALRRRRWLTVPWPRGGEVADPGPGVDEGDPELAVALAALPVRQRTALWLRYGLDMSTADVGAVLGTSETAAKQLLLRARAQLRRSMPVEDA